MSDKTLSLDDLRVVDYLYTDDEAIGPHRVATREDVLVVLVRDLGGVGVEPVMDENGFDWWLPLDHLALGDDEFDKPGRYLIVPLDTGDTE